MIQASLNFLPMSNDSTRRAEFAAYFEKRFGGDRQRFMQETGISKGRVSQYFDEEESFGELAAIRLAERLGVQPGEIFRSLSANKPPKSGKKPGVPVVGTAQLGDNGHFCELQYPVGHGDGQIRWASKDGSAYAVRCKGESMKPRIRNGEFVIVEPSHQFAPGDEVLVRSLDGRVMVKQLAYVRDGMVHLDSVNESHPRISIEETEIESIQYVAGIAKSALWDEE
jgi:phage repressor protein C with HTH and peptisase S24 domain